MVSEEEAERLYREVLEHIGEPLANDVARGVLRSALRGEFGVRTDGGSIFDVREDGDISVSNRDALIVAIRTLLAVLDVVFQVSEVKRIVGHSEEAGDGKMPDVVWRAEQEAEWSKQALGKAATAEPLPLLSGDDLADIRRRAGRLIEVLHRLEDEQLGVEGGAEKWLK